MSPRDVRRAALEAFRIGDWLVEPSLNQLSRAETIVHLRPQLIDLLAFLVSHAGEVVSKRDILDAVWPERFVSESALTACMTELRHALATQAAHRASSRTSPSGGTAFC